jgi:hypothetical protein
MEGGTYDGGLLHRYFLGRSGSGGIKSPDKEKPDAQLPGLLQDVLHWSGKGAVRWSPGEERSAENEPLNVCARTKFQPLQAA